MYKLKHISPLDDATERFKIFSAFRIACGIHRRIKSKKVPECVLEIFAERVADKIADCIDVGIIGDEMFNGYDRLLKTYLLEQIDTGVIVDKYLRDFYEI